MIAGMALHIGGGLMETRERSCVRRIQFISAVIFSLALLLAGMSTSRAQDTSQRAVEPDLTGAHLDKRKFLLGLSMLGKSARQDVDLLSKLTGVKVEPKPVAPRAGKGIEESFRAFIRLQEKDRISGNTDYWYGVLQNNGYRVFIASELEYEVNCIRFEDLIDVLGQPSEMPKRPPTAHGIVQGPSNVWIAQYSLAFGRKLLFRFLTQECASSLSVTGDSK